MAGITVVEESALTALAEGREGRRTGYSGFVSIHDRDQILVIGGGSASDVVGRRSPAYVCTPDFGQLCGKFGGREGEVLVCVAERRSFSAILELDAIPSESVVMAEFYGPTVGFDLLDRHCSLPWWPHLRGRTGSGSTRDSGW